MSKDEIRPIFDRWIACLGLRWWKIEILWYDDPGEIVKEFGGFENEIVVARTYADWRYGSASIHINTPEWEKMDADEVEDTVIHELVHILVNEMREGELHHEERVVTGLTKAFQWTWDAAQNYEPGQH